jgi:hypothetical protein
MINRIKKLGILLQIIALTLVIPTISNAETMEDTLAHTAESLNKHTPRRLNTITVLSSIMSYGKELMYLCTIEAETEEGNELIKLFREQHVERIFLKKQKAHTTNAMCTNPMLKRFLEEGVTIENQYVYEDGTFIGEIKIDKNDCNN